MSNQRFEERELIGAGGFGKTYRAIDKCTGKKVAIKVESANLKFKQLKHEYRTYKKLGPHPNLPKIHGFFEESANCPATLSMELLDETLEERFEACRRTFPLKLVIAIALQLLQVIEHIHSHGVIHQDIKPENILFDRKTGRRIRLVDLGLSASFLDPVTRQVVPLNITNRGLTGTDRFAGVNAHLGHNQARRDDIESIGFIIIYLRHGRLPWQGLNTSSMRILGNRDASKKRSRAICDLKIEIPLEKLCSGLEPEILEYMRACRRLKYDERPDYAAFQEFFRAIARRRGIPEFVHYSNSTQAAASKTSACLASSISIL